MNPPEIDASVFAELQDTAGAEFVGELVGTFFEEAPQMLAELRAAQAAGDGRTLPPRRAFAQVQQQHLRRTEARRDGAHAGARRAAGRRPPIDALEAEYARVAAALKELTVADCPRRAASPPRGSRALGRPGIGGRLRLLVADDNKVNRLLLTRSLELQGHRVSSAENGRVALDMLRREAFDLLLLDMEMPEMDGFQVLEHLAADAQLRDLPVIVTSSLEGVAHVARCIELGADDYLPKPVNPVLLKARINSSLEKKRLRDQQKALVRRFATSEVAEDLQQSGFSLGGKRVVGTVMFCDIRGFTSIVEQQTPEETIELLNTYYTLMFDAISGRGGVVNQMIGDGLMAIFGAPLPLADAPRQRGARGAGDDRDDRAAQRRARAPPARPRCASASASPPATWSPATPARSRAPPTPASATRSTWRRGWRRTPRWPARPILIDADTAAGLGAALALEPLGGVQLKGKAAAVEVLCGVRLGQVHRGAL